MTLPAEESRLLFIRRWGEMGANWGISRTMAEIHALLFVSTEPLCTDDVMERLSVSRGNASMNLRQLVNWGLVYRQHRTGDRKEYFGCETDVWQMFETITRERRRREVEPIIETIKRCQAMTREDLKSLRGARRKEVEQYQRRLDEMLEFLNLMNRVFNLVIQTGQAGVGRLAKLLARFAR
ncbi:MAG: ArsR family transcriptional regulator [bacterium]|nr:ArsR family transcriptional regulator [bacterium]